LVLSAHSHWLVLHVSAYHLVGPTRRVSGSDEHYTDANEHLNEVFVEIIIIIIPLTSQGTIRYQL
jgi:hypothetical protein